MVKNDFYSYLDAFNKITIIIKKSLCTTKKSFCLLRTEYADNIYIDSIEDLGESYKYNCRITEEVQLNQDYTILDESNNRSHLRSGKIVRSDLFEMMYYYEDDDLGVTYYPDKTIFKIWSPVAKEIELELISRSGKMSFYDLSYTTSGVWCIELEGNWEGYRYRYNVRVNEQFEVCNDPYAISSSANGEYNYVIDINKLYQFKNPRPEFSGKYVDSVIYEASVRDFTIDPSSDAMYKGKYLGMVENHPKNGCPTGIAYLSFLGVTHLQLMPVYDFGGVDELHPNKYYNWGYNPEQYNVPEGWFSLNPEDPYSRINELRQVIDSAHANGIRVNMDVVYNHVYDMFKFPMDTLVPGYFFRVDQNDILTEVSGCQNDVASERLMMRKFIIDSLIFWTKFYKISGFRFDLMGLLDIETMNKANVAIKAIEPNAMLYGEGWNMPNTLPNNLRAHMFNYERMPQIAFFNDKFRDIMRGNAWNRNLGFSYGSHSNMHEFVYLFTGSCVDNYLFSNPNQTLNYVECHDNYTFYDFGKIFANQLTEKQYKDYGCLAISLVLICQGIPFIHSGQEFLRTKKLVENSYNSSDDINKFDWDLRDKNFDMVLMVRDLIRIRKKYKEFRFTNQSIIKERVRFLGHQKGKSSCWFKIQGAGYELIIAIKNDYILEEHNNNTKVVTLFDSRKSVNECTDMLVLEQPGVYIYYKEK